MMRLAVVIVSYNVKELLRRCLDSLYTSLRRSSELDAQVWVVDNASSDGSAEMVRREFPAAKLIVNDDNLGFAAASNQAMRALEAETRKPDFIFLLNPDTEVLDRAPYILARFLQQHPDVALAGPRLLYPDGRLQHSAFRFPGVAQIFFDFFPIHHRLAESRLNGRYPRHLYEKGEPFPIDHPLGAAMMVKWEAIEQVGFLDEGFFMYCEEIDWCMRFRAAGWGVYCVPEAKIIHHVAQSTRQFRDEMFVQLWRSRYRLFRKHYGPGFVRVARVLVNIGLRWEMRKARKAAQEGLIGEEELRSRLEAYRRVMEMGDG